MFNIKKLREVLAIQSYSHEEIRMVCYLIDEISAMGLTFTEDKAGNMYIKKGDADIYPCIVAHMDTVHRITQDLTVIKVGDNLTGMNRITMEQTGIGGDDKVGIFIALECLKKFDNIKVAFFSNEETGCEGSYAADMEFFKDCSFVLQCDRKGNSDFITDASGVELSSIKFQDAIETILMSRGYKFDFGFMTDVMALKENGLGVCCANISCGYYNPHSESEYVNIPDVENCMNMVFEIMESIGGQEFEHNYVPAFKRSYGKADRGIDKDWHNDYTWNSKTQKYDFKGDKKKGATSYEKSAWEKDMGIEQSDLCADCNSYPAESNGLCKSCNDFYYSEYKIRPENPKQANDLFQDELHNANHPLADDCPF